MRIMAREYKEARKAPLPSTVLEIIGVFQFIGASWFVLALTVNLRDYLRPEVYLLCLIVGIFLGLSASVTSFAFSRIVADLYATRWHTDSYEVERDDDERLMMEGMARDLSVIARALAPEQAAALEAADDAQEAADDNTEADPYDDEPAPEEAPKKPKMTLNDWLWVVAALLIIAVIFVGQLIFQRLR